MRAILLSVSLLAVAACGPRPQVQISPEGQPLQAGYRISPEETDAVQIRMLDSVNTLRQAAGLVPVAYDSRLNAAAATHSRDMALQNRPWHFGSDGSSPLDRARRVGYPGLILGETISESYETELQTLGAWMERPETREILLDRRARQMGFAWFQEESGKLWWTLVLGTTAITAPAVAPLPPTES
ncbi:CAP domain-containing protein [Histidinibacterium lentulum]|uniref:CAP domain-containing protein n=1 Tax=Histidinibacterium lentulum TaxID=2480588 RepID=A0A3N2R6U0_9RHOB|nr:CAP domain-containing protein [Histidinibacterium lentulum]ROU03091.1 CAP domain-containing protein [Histidinibacterium lentulum]